MSHLEQYCTFFVDGHCFGIPVDRVEEIVRQGPMTRVPLAPREVVGLVNLRGRIVMAVDLRRRFRLPDRESRQLGYHVIVRAGEEVVSFVVDEMGDVRDVDAAQFAPPPDTLRSCVNELISGTYTLEERLLMALEVAKVADVGGSFSER